MAYVVTLRNYRPSPRYDGDPWTEARIEESDSPTGVFVQRAVIALDPLDTDPRSPQLRNFTISNAVYENGYYRVTFYDAAGNQQPTGIVPGGTQGYPSADELVSESTVDALTTLTPEEQDALYAAARNAIEEYTGQSFGYEADVLYTLDGSGTSALYLPRRLEAITLLEVSRSALEAADVELSPERDRLIVSPEGAIGNYYSRTLRELDGGYPAIFTSGSGTVRITGDWGWTVFPRAIREALRIDMEDQALADQNALTQTIRSYRRLGLRDVRQGNLSAAIGGVSFLSPKVATLLQPYVWHGPVGAVV